MQMEGRAEDASVETALAHWRQKAANVLMTATVFAYLPAIILILAGHGPQVAWPVKAVVLAVYAVTITCAVFRRGGYRGRIWIFMLAGYVAMIVGNIADPTGNFIRAMPVVLPMLMMVLFGAWVGRVATAASIGILLLTPFIHGMPCLAGILTLASAGPQALPSIVHFQGVALIALLVAPMILLERFHQFLMRSLGDRIAAYDRLEREMRERRRLEHEVARAADEERRRLGAEIHDGICQQLTGALLRSEALGRRVERGETPTSGELSALSRLLEKTIDEAHATAQGLCPLDSDPEALVAALRTLTKRTQEVSGITCSFESMGHLCVRDSSVAHHLHRIAQEAMNNAVRHARASRIGVRLTGNDAGLFLDVEDNGAGLPEGISTSGMGLSTMSYRARFMEGELTVSRMPGGGTRVSCRVPCMGIPPGNTPQQGLEEVCHAH